MISNNSQNGKLTLINMATFTHSKYDIQPQTQTGQKCSKTFTTDTEKLDTENYDQNSYLSFVKRFGTHIIVGASFGGSITAVSTYDPCTEIKGTNSNSKDKYYTTDAVRAKYQKEIGDFTVYGKTTDISFLGQVVRRDGMSVCGGNIQTFQTDDKQPFNSWIKTFFNPNNENNNNNNNNNCVITFNLIPIYATIPIEDERRILLESAVLDYMNQANRFVKLNKTQISTCKKKSVKASQSPVVKATTHKL